MHHCWQRDSNGFHHSHGLNLGEEGLCCAIQLSASWALERMCRARVQMAAENSYSTYASLQSTSNYSPVLSGILKAPSGKDRTLHFVLCYKHGICRCHQCHLPFCNYVHPYQGRADTLVWFNPPHMKKLYPTGLFQAAGTGAWHPIRSCKQVSRVSEENKNSVCFCQIVCHRRKILSWPLQGNCWWPSWEKSLTAASQTCSLL